MKLRLPALCAAFALLIQSAAYSATVTISGSGTWDADINSNGIYSAPNAAWSFSFDVDSPIASSTPTPVTNGQYLLNGSIIADSITSMVFFPLIANGLFDLYFESGATISLYGPQIYSDGTGDLIAGLYPAEIVDHSSLPDAPGLGSGNVLVSVPEPSSLIMSGIAIVAIGGIASRRRRKIVA